MATTTIKTQQLASGSVTLPKLGSLTTAGDLVTYDTGHARLPVGSNGQVLTVDTTAATSLKWANPKNQLFYANTSVPAGNTVANTVSETAFTSSYTLAANALSAGQVLRMSFSGVLSSDLLLSGLTLKLKYGSTVLFTTSSQSLLSSLVNRGWNIQYTLIVFTSGASGTVDGQGIAMLPISTLAFGDVGPIMLSTAASISVNTTTSQALTMTATWNRATTSNTITLRNMVIESLA